MRAPSVSGAQGYKELCLAAKNEEKRLAKLKRQKYLRPTTLVSQHPSSRKPVYTNLLKSNHRRNLRKQGLNPDIATSATRLAIWHVTVEPPGQRAVIEQERGEESK